MTNSTPAAEGPQSPPVIIPGGTYPIQKVTVGCKLFIRRPVPGGQTEERLAEILSIRDKPNNPYASRRSSNLKNEVGGSAEQEKPEDKWEFFVHWDQFNKRLDDWVAGSRLVLSRDMEWPRPKTQTAKKGGNEKKAPAKVPKNQNLLKKATSNAALHASPPAPTRGGTPATASSRYSPSPTPSGAATPLGPSLKRKAPHDEQSQTPEGDAPTPDVDMDADGDADGEADMDIDADGDPDNTFELSLTDTPTEPPPSVSSFSKEKEIEKLRTTGSMTQSISEIARVKNLNRLQMGKYEVDAWYFSPYPKEYAHLPVLYICEFCLTFYPSPMMYSRHRARCTMLHPPGNEIYRHEDISFYEIDGKRQLTWCRNLSLLSKCFLDHKTLYYDVTPFLYYVMVQRDSTGQHIIGYFSKEKESAENYNVACILTLPQHQRFGYGKLLIEFSYELTKVEGKQGSPEKPLSDLGLLGYRSYWAEKIIDFLETVEGDVSIDEIANKTAITHADIMNTCSTLQLIKHYKGAPMICLNAAVMERHQKKKAKARRHINPEALRWKPPVFTRDQLRFGW